jgi:diaminobutyrate-2-oxoglutarate transaminase
VTIFDDRESAVRSYCRTWPTVFDRAAGSWLYDERGKGYLDFFAGAGALNYGHNNSTLKSALRGYIDTDRVIHSLDMHTVAKREFLTALTDLILTPRGLDYRVQFPGPGGTNAVEAALKLARKVTGRTEVICFTNSFHGMTLGALAVTGSEYHRRGAGVPMTMATRLPFDQPSDPQNPDSAWFEAVLEDSACRPIEPAAVIVETVQGEGGVNVARPQWLRGLADWCKQRDMLLIVDDVQMGCGRTGPFFSFEIADIQPDLVCMSKSISGYGLPMALTFLRPDLDIWLPGEHNGTFRGFDPAFVTGTEALRTYWTDDTLERRTHANEALIHNSLVEIVNAVPGNHIEPRGRGLVHGLAFDVGELAGKVSEAAFCHGLLVETAGPDSEVVKLMPPLTISDEELEHGLAILADAVLGIC